MWSFKMKAYCAAHVTKLYDILIRLIDDKTMDNGRTVPVSNGLKRWRSMATCWEPKASFNVQKALHVILLWNTTPDTDATQLLAVWAD